MTPVFRLLIPTLALAALGACDRDKPAATRASAEGEILEGSVSDAMLPLDTVRSQAPLAPRSEASGGAGERQERSRSAPREPGSAPAEAAAEPAAAPAVVEEEATPAEE